jgi:hypothetical protein
MKRNHSLASRRSTAFSSANAHRKIALFALLLCSLPFALASGAELKQARVTQVVHDVKLLPGQAAPRPAAISDQVREGTAVRTGEESRAELTFTDRTLTRLGANTIFSFDQGTRNLQLGGGAMLLRVPKDAGGARINTAAITAAITGTTMLLEYHPNAYCKFIMLEGVARIFRNNRVGESVLLRPGQMLIVNPNGKGLPEPVDVDLDRLMKTSLLITGFDPLPSLDLIAQVVSEQSAKKNEGAFIDTNLAIFGSGTTVSLIDPTNAILADQANANETRQPEETPTPTEEPPPPPPSKFGPPTTITSSTPYVINNGTVIQTDPTITTNGVTDFGVIYEGPEIDGAFSSFALDSTSEFDTESGFDEQIDSSGAVFKFTSLQLAGDPTISTTDGESNLALIGVNGITSGGPGGVLTFAGLNGLLLATVDGSITLGPEISFEGLNDLTFYARGAESSLTLGCDITTLNQLNLYSEGDINLSGAVSTGDFFSFSNGDFNFTGSSLDSQTLSINSGGDIKFATGGALDFNTTSFVLQAGGDINSDGSLEVTQTTQAEGGLLTTFVLAGGDIDTDGNLTLVNDNSNGGELEAGANIFLSANGDINVGSGLILNVLNNNGGHIGAGGDIFVSTGGDLAAGSIDALINNRDAGTTDNGGILSFNIGGDLTTSSDAAFIISARNDGGGGGTFGSAVSLALNAASISVGGFLDFAISANAGGVIPSAFLSVSASGSVFSGSGYSSLIQSTGFNVPGGPFIEGGTISGDALLLLDFGSASSGDYFDIEIDNFGQGTIGGEALLSAALTGDLNAAGDIFTDIINTAALRGDTIVPGGTIGGDATVSVFSGGDIIAGGIGEFAVLNNDLNFLSEAGSITGDANVFLDAVNITTGGFFQPLVNNTNGSIGGSAAVEIDVTDDITVGAETFFNILNSNGAIGGSALSDLFASNFTSGSTFQFQILNDNGSIGSDSTLFASVSDALTIGSDATMQIGNAGGSIAGDATIEINLGSFSANSLLLQIENLGGFIGGDSSIIFITEGDFTAGSVTALINNRDSGEIDGSSTLAFDAVGAVNLSGDLSLKISSRDDGGGSGTMGGPADLFVNADSISLGGLLDTGVTPPLEGNSIPSVSASYNVVGDFIVGGSTAFGLTNGGFGLDGFHGGGVIEGDALLSIDAGSFSSGDFLNVFLTNIGGGAIDGDATISIFTSGSLSAVGQTILQLANGGGGETVASGTIGGDASLSVNPAGGVTIQNFFGVEINNDGGTIDGDALLDFSTGTGDINTTGDALFDILDGFSFDAFGSIGGDAIATLTANNLSSGGSFTFQLLNAGGSIGGSGIVDLNLSGDLTSQSDTSFLIENFGDVEFGGGGFIGGDAAIDVSAANTTANSLVAQIDNTAGTIDGTASINMNVPGNTTLTSDATIEILGSDGAGAAAIDFNGGTYDVGATFRSTIDGDGTITFNNASVNADALKSGVFGDNGTLTVGGGRLSGSTELKLYAPGANGQVNFISNVTLDSESSVIIAANTVTINNGVVVTITGDDGADAFVFTNVPNYSEEFGGNGSTTGTFDGNGAETFPLDEAPPFDGDFDAPANGATASTTALAPTPMTDSGSGDGAGGADAGRAHRKRGIPVARVANTDDLLALLDKIPADLAGPGGSNPATGKKTRGASSLSSGKGRATVQNLDRANMALNRTGARRPAALP